MPSTVNWGKRPTTKPSGRPAPSVEDFVSGGAEKTTRLNVLIPSDLHKRVKSACANEGASMTDVVVEFLEGRFPKK
jgi:hypothetical protein